MTPVKVALRFRKRRTFRLFIAMVLHTVTTKHAPGYDVEWDGLDCYFVCRVCGKRALYGTLKLPEES